MDFSSIQHRKSVVIINKLLFNTILYLQVYRRRTNYIVEYF